MLTLLTELKVGCGSGQQQWHTKEQGDLNYCLIVDFNYIELIIFKYAIIANSSKIK